MILDDLHFATGSLFNAPRGTDQVQSRRQFNVDAPMRARRHAEVIVLQDMIQDYTSASIRFQVESGVRSAEEVYQCVLLEMLKEGRTQ